MVDIKAIDQYIFNMCPNNVNKIQLQKRREKGNRMFANCLIDTNWE